jgi:hypothetical protein
VDTPEGMRHVSFHVETGDKVFVYSDAPRILLAKAA